MEQLWQEIKALLESNGGGMEYSALIEALDFPKRQRAMDAIRYGKQFGEVRRVNRVDPENGLQPLRIELVSQE